jgi:hypothetical protein
MARTGAAWAWVSFITDYWPIVGAKDEENDAFAALFAFAVKAFLKVVRTPRAKKYLPADAGTLW